MKKYNPKKAAANAVKALQAEYENIDQQAARALVKTFVVWGAADCLDGWVLAQLLHERGLECSLRTGQELCLTISNQLLSQP